MNEFFFGVEGIVGCVNFDDVGFGGEEERGGRVEVFLGVEVGWFLGVVVSMRICIVIGF